MLNRFSSRHKRLDHAFLRDRLKNAKSYNKDRWELCSQVLSRRDVVDRLSLPWGTIQK